MPCCGVISGALLKSDDGVIWGYSWILSSFDEFYTSFFASFDWRVNSELKKFIGPWLRWDIWISAGDGVTWCVDISGCSHDQAWVSHIMHIIGECLPGWQWGLERVTSADDLDLLASSSCLRVTTLANSLESCSVDDIQHLESIHPQDILCDPVYFSDVHIMCTTLHLTVPHPPACPTYHSEHSDISAYFENWNLGC